MRDPNGKIIAREIHNPDGSTTIRDANGAITGRESRDTSSLSPAGRDGRDSASEGKDPKK